MLEKKLKENSASHNRHEVRKWAYLVLIGVSHPDCMKLRKNRKKYVNFDEVTKRVIELSQAVDIYLHQYFYNDEEIMNEEVVELLDRKNFMRHVEQTMPSKLYEIFDGMRIKGSYDVDL